MAKVTQNAPYGFLEDGRLVVDFSGNNVLVADNIEEIISLRSSKPMTNLIAICNSGSLLLSIGDSMISIEESELLVYTLNDDIKVVEKSSDFKCMFLCVSDYIIRGLLHDKIDFWLHSELTSKLVRAKLSENDRTELSWYFLLLKQRINNTMEYSNDILLALLRALLLELYHLRKDASSTQENLKMSQGKRLFNRFQSLLSSNDIKRRPITFYASKLSITPKYLTMLCLKYSGMTASDWIIQYTKEDIRFYLLNSNLSIKEISAKLGFANMSHFGSYVRKYLGKSPSDFRHSK
jgi:AraC-like DNA-binding protein